MMLCQHVYNISIVQQSFRKGNEIVASLRSLSCHFVIRTRVDNDLKNIIDRLCMELVCKLFLVRIIGQS